MIGLECGLKSDEMKKKKKSDEMCPQEFRLNGDKIVSPE